MLSEVKTTDFFLRNDRTKSDMSLLLFFPRYQKILVRKKEKLYLCLVNEALRHEGVWGSGSINLLFLDLGTSWRWVVTFTARPLYTQKRAPGTHWIWGWVDPRTGLNDVEKRKFLTLPGLKLRPLGCPGRSQSLYLIRYPGSLSENSTALKFSMPLGDMLEAFKTGWGTFVFRGWDGRDMWHARNIQFSCKF
jgi:hypothetical protein